MMTLPWSMAVWYTFAMPSAQQEKLPIQPLAPQAQAAADVQRLQAKVTELLLDYGVVYLETDRGLGLAFNARTEGIVLADLRVGQSFECEVTSVQPRVLRARRVG